jgi:hypothetical protein
MATFFVTRKALAWLVSIGVTTVVIASCTKQSEDKLQAQQGGGTNTCDTTNMKYSVNVAPILSANCYSCHGNGIVNAGVTLDSYSNVLIQVKNGNIIGAITHASGYVPMPYGGGMLSDCDIATIKAWINEGAPNN